MCVGGTWGWLKRIWRDFTLYSPLAELSLSFPLNHQFRIKLAFMLEILKKAEIRITPVRPSKEMSVFSVSRHICVLLDSLHKINCVPCPSLSLSLMVGGRNFSSSTLLNEFFTFKRLRKITSVSRVFRFIEKNLFNWFREQKAWKCLREIFWFLSEI